MRTHSFLFSFSDLAPLIQHALGAKERRPTFGQMYLGVCRKDGVDQPESALPRPEDVDPAKVPAGLWLVHDEGVYLMSNGVPMMERPARVIYAKGYAPRAVRMSGDDFAEFIEAETLRDLAAAGAQRLVIRLSDDAMEICSDAPRGPSPSVSV